MTIVVRHMQVEDAFAFLEVHHAAVRAIAAKDYPLSVIEGWAPLPITENAIASFRANPDGEVRLVAEADGQMVGIGALVLANNELRACRRTFALSSERWKKFQKTLDAPPRPLPRLGKLLREPSLFDEKA